MKKISALKSIFKRSHKVSPKQRVRDVMEVGSGYKWELEEEDDDVLSYASTTQNTSGLCLYFDGHMTLSPETRIRRFDKSIGDFFFDDAPAQVLTFKGNHASDVELVKALRVFLESWLSRDNWVFSHEKVSENKRSDEWTRWVFKHREASRPMLAIGEIAFTDMPSGYQINVENVMEADSTEPDKSVKHLLCISVVRKS